MTVVVEAATCQSARAESQLQHLLADRRGGAVVMRPSRRVLKALQALLLQALHLTYETGPFVTYDVPAWASGRPSRVVVSSAGLIITVTDGEEKSSNAKDGARQGQALSLMMVVDHSDVTATSTGLDGADLIRRC